MHKKLLNISAQNARNFMVPTKKFPLNKIWHTLRREALRFPVIRSFCAKISRPSILVHFAGGYEYLNYISFCTLKQGTQSQTMNVSKRAFCAVQSAETKQNTQFL